MDGDLSLIRFCTMNYFAVLLQSRPFFPISTLLIKIVSSLISAEPEPNEKDRKRVTWLLRNTHKKVMQDLSIVELAVFRNLDRGLNREIDFDDKTFTLTELYMYLDEVAVELTNIVIGIAKKYSVDIPVQAFGSMTGQANVQNIEI